MRSPISTLIARRNPGQYLPIGLLIIVAALMLAGCGSPSANSISDGSGVINLSDLLIKASATNQPIALLIIESRQSRADEDARAWFEAASKRIQNAGVIPVLLDIAISRNRAAAARFHLTNTPALLCLSPQGLIVSHDESSITAGLLSQRMEAIAAQAAGLDKKLAALAKAAVQNPDRAQARFELADFFLSRQNAREAIPRLEFVAYDEEADKDLRIRAWVALARAHIWVAEPEKGRHEAQDLITTLGPNSDDAIAAGNLVIGIQDATGKHPDLARQEFQAAVAASPDSPYGKQAAEELAKLPGSAK